MSEEEEIQMALVEIKVPMLPESVADATILNVHKKAGDAVKRDEILFELETDKVVLEVPALESGVVTEITHAEGATVLANDILAKIDTAASNTATSTTTTAIPNATPVTAAAAATSVSVAANVDLSPAVRRLVAEKDIDPTQVQGTGKGGRITKDDIQQATNPAAAPAISSSSMPMGAREEKRVPMSRLRAKIAERLVQAQHNAAMLTTFNEVNLQAVMDLRKQYQDDFVKKHGVKLGFMSFFTKAVVESLKRFPAVNASLDGNDIVYHGYYDIGIAVSTERGLVVPVMRNVDTMNLADMEKNINDFAGRARANKLDIEDLQGGTFTITNGGVFGSLLSTPIINPPQVGILGMHKIEERAVVENGQVVVRPMMYIALSYDHRLIDGRESVQFLATVKALLEDPARLLLDI